MPNTLPPTDSAQRLLEKTRRASRKILVNVGFHAAAVKDRSAAKAMKVAGAFSMQLYLPKTIAPLEGGDGRAIVPGVKAAKEGSLPITVHADNASQIEGAGTVRGFKELARCGPGTAE